MDWETFDKINKVKKLLLTNEEAAKMLSVSEDVINELIENNKLETIEIKPDVVRVRAKSVREYVGKNNELSQSNKPIDIKSEKFVNSREIFMFYWLITIIVFIAQIVALLTTPNDYLISSLVSGLVFANIGLGVTIFLGIFIKKRKPKNNKVSFLSKHKYLMAFIYSMFMLLPVLGDINNMQSVEMKTTPTPMLTVEPTVTPKVIPKKTVKPIQKAVDTDPIVDCVSTHANCNGSSIKLRRSQCSNIFCCGFGDGRWVVYSSEEECNKARNSSIPQTVNNPQIVPTTAVYIPNANKVPVFLTYGGRTIYCPSQNVDAVKAIDATMKSKSSEWAKSFNDCSSNFFKTDSCYVSCSNIEKSKLDSCSSLTGDAYTTCSHIALDYYADCIKSCPYPTVCDSTQWEQKSLSSQISNLCK